MAKESFQALLRRVALAHIDRKTQQYIKSLETVAEAAKAVVEGEQILQPQLQPLRTALLELETANAS